jgi:hypothetical protein
VNGGVSILSFLESAHQQLESSRMGGRASVARRCTHLFAGFRHDLWPVVDCEHDIRDTGCGESLDLMLDHGSVGELDERLGEGEGLSLVRRSFVSTVERCRLGRLWCGGLRGHIAE